MGRISRGWALTKASFSLLGKEKQMLLFPIISVLLIILLFIGFLVMFFFSFFLGLASGGVGYFGASGILVYIMFFIFYVLAHFISKFFEAAVVETAASRFRGKDPTFGSALSAASSKIGRIFLWALLSASVGTLLKIIERARFGRIIRFIAGIVWGIATFFVMPIILFEEKGVLGSIKRSVELLRKSWGESLIAVLGTGVIFFLIALIGFMPIVISLFLGLGIMAIVASLVFLFIYILVVALFASVVRNIVVTGLYVYAADGKLSDPGLDKIVRNIEKM